MAGPIRGYDTLAQLRAEAAPLGAAPTEVLFFFCNETGYTYKWSSTSTAADDGSATIAPTSSSTSTGNSAGRYIAQVAGAALDVLAALAIAPIDVAINSKKLTLVATPTLSTDAATKGYADSLGTGSKMRKFFTVVSTTFATGVAQPASLTDATMAGIVAGGSVGGAGLAGAIAVSTVTDAAEQSTGAGQEGLGSAAAAAQPLNSTDFPGQRMQNVELRKKDGDEITLTDVLTTAGGADANAKVYAYLSYRSDKGADLKWRLWYYYRRAADGFETPITPDISVTSAQVIIPRVDTLANAPIDTGAPTLGQSAAQIAAGVVGDIAAVGTTAAGASGRFADAAHVHAHGNLAGGSFHARAVAATSAGFADATYMASPDPIGGTAAAAGTFTTCTATTAFSSGASTATSGAYRTANNPTGGIVSTKTVGGVTTPVLTVDASDQLIVGHAATGTAVWGCLYNGSIHAFRISGTNKVQIASTGCFFASSYPVGFNGATPFNQPTAYTMTYNTGSRINSNPTAAVVATTAAALASYGFTQAQADSIPVAINALVTDVLNLKQVLTQALKDLGAGGAGYGLLA